MKVQHFQILWKSDAAECLLLRGVRYGISWKKQKALYSSIGWEKLIEYLLMFSTPSRMCLCFCGLCPLRRMLSCVMPLEGFKFHSADLLYKLQKLRLSAMPKYCGSLGPASCCPGRKGIKAERQDGKEWFLLSAYTRE